MNGWNWAVASSRGTSHIALESRCDDAYWCDTPDKNEAILAAVLSDGAGSARYGAQGAILTCRRFSLAFRDHFRETSVLPGEDWFAEVLSCTRALIENAAAKRSVLSREFAATLLAVASSAEGSVVAHVGDGALALRRQSAQGWEVPSWPSHGEYASTTYFVTDLPSPSLSVSHSDGAATHIVAFTDGLERLALDFGSCTPYAPFFDGVSRPLECDLPRGRNPQLSRQLASFLGSERINTHTDDDKTLLVATRSQ